MHLQVLLASATPPGGAPQVHQVSRCRVGENFRLSSASVVALDLLCLSCLCRQFRSEKTDRVRKDALFSAIVKRCRQQRQCPFCGELNGVVK